MARTKYFDEEEVLNKAMNLFWDKGYAGTSMQDLVDGLGISRSSLYDTYGDKHTLFIRTIEHYRASACEKMKAITDRTPSAKDQVKQLLEFATSELLSDKQQKGCFLVNVAVEVAPHDQEVSNLVCQNDKQLEDLFYNVIKSGQENGEIRNKQDARSLSRFIINNVKGLRVTAKTATDKQLFSDIIELTLSALN